MAWKLAGTTIPKPQEIKLRYDIKEVYRKVLSGSYVKRVIGNGARILECTYSPIDATSYNAIRSHYDDQRLHGTIKTIVVDELGLSFSAHITIQDSDYNIKNNYDYFDFSVTFTERL